MPNRPPGIPGSPVGIPGSPVGIPGIDRRLVMLDWWYEAEFDYDRVEVFSDNGIEFFVCPGTSTWNSLSAKLPLG